MADYWVCSDNIDGKENKRIDALCDALKKAGHTAHNGGVGPNTIQSHGQTSGSKGQIGVFICGGVDIQVFWDFVQGIGRYYHYKRFIYVYASDTATTDKWLTCNGAKNTKTVKAWDDNYSGGRGDAIGKTVDAYCNEHKDKIWYACGTKGCDFKEVIDNFLKGEGAGDGSSDSDSKDSKESNSGSSIKEAIQKLLTHWDGEVECYIRGDTVHINKIRNPQKYYSTIIQEGVNVFLDTVTVTDVNPDTPNQLVVEWTGGTITFTDEHSIKRFGVVEEIVQATKGTEVVETPKTEKKTEKTTEDSEDSTNYDELDTSVFEEEEDTSEKTTTVQKPIDNYKEALEFAHLYWNKLQRDNGRTLECQVLGSTNWKAGEWSKVYIPSYNLDGFMYVTRVSQSNDAGDWTANLSLVDYPPGWGKEEKKEDSSSSDDENSDNPSSSKIDEAIKQITEEISKFSYSGSCSDGKCIKSTKKGDCWALSDYIYNRLKDSGISAKIHQYKTSSSNQHRQVEYKSGNNWVMFPYSKSGIDHTFYTNSIPSDTKIVKD